MQIEFNKVTWYSKLGALILFIFVIPSLTFYIGRKYEEVQNLSIYTEIPDSKIIKSLNSDYLNSTYNIDGETIILKNGKADNVTIFGKPVMADLNGDNKEDAVFFLVQDTSGTGVFTYVVTSISKDAVFIGDRISPQNINVDNKGLIKVNYVTRKENEPFSAEPSVGVTKYFKVINRELVEIKADH